MRREAIPAVVVAFLLVAASVVDLSLLFREGGDVPTDDEYRAVAALVDEDGFRAENDVLAVLPAWSMRPAVHLRPRPMISGDALESRPLDRHRRLYVLVESDGEAAFRRVQDQQPHTAKRIFESRALSVWRIDIDGTTVTFDVRADLDRADIRIAATDGKELTACRDKVKGGFRCSGKKSWQRVTRETLLVSENGDDAIWAHPPSPNERLEVRFNDVTLFDEIVIRTGHTRTGAEKATAPVKFEVIHGDSRLHAMDVVPRFSFSTVRIDTRAFRATTGPLTLRMSTINNGTQHFAFDGFVVRRDAP